MRIYKVGNSYWTAVSTSEHNAIKVSLQGQDLHLEELRPDGRVLDRNAQTITVSSPDHYRPTLPPLR
jgi:hypothetical protein